MAMAQNNFERLAEFDGRTHSTNEGPSHQPCPKRYRGAGRNWVKTQEFDCAESALKFVEQEKSWSITSRHDTCDGEKVQFRCNTVRRRGVQCGAAIYLLYHSEKETVSLYRTDEQHDHADKISQRGIDPEIRSTIRKLYDVGVKTPKAILLSLAKHGLPQPPINQLRNFLKNYKRAADGPPTMNIGEFVQFCLNHSQPPADDRNGAFVVSHSHGLNPDGSSWIKLFMSTPRLLEWATKSHVLHADATYKLNWEGLPVIVVGSTDLDRRFHPIGIGVTSGETAEDYAFIFRAVVAGVEMVAAGTHYQPDILIAGAADAITNGFAAVFGAQFRRITCWFHVVKAIEKKANKIYNREFRQRIIDDIHELQLCESERIFDAVVQLFVRKWHRKRDQDVDVFLRYFVHEWIASHKNWFEGFSPNTPSTNNALESTNASIKRDGTLRNRLPLPRFLNLMAHSILRPWAYERDSTNPAYKPFAIVPSKDTALWTKSYQWATDSKEVLSKARGDGWRDYYIPSGSETVFGPQRITEYRNAFRDLSWGSFDEYAAMRNRLWVLSIYGDHPESSSCNCPVFLKEYICKHSVGVAIRQGWCVVPEVAKQTLIGRKRKRGRPRLATSALNPD